MGNDHGKIAIVAGGALEEDFIPGVLEADVIIGVDFGAFWLLEQGIVPHAAIGDFDSVDDKQYKVIKEKVHKVIKFSKEKDATDLELAVGEAIKSSTEEVWIYGGLGSRFDHSFAGIQMLLKLESHNICGYLVDKTNKINIVRQVEKFSRTKEYKYISFFPIDKTAIISLEGFKYNDNKLKISRGSTISVSNEILAQTAKITVHEGLVLAVQSKD